MEPLQVEVALLAQFARVDASGLMNVIGGGIDFIVVPAVPSAEQLSVVLRVTMGETERGPWLFTLRVQAPSGKLVVEVPAVVQLVKDPHIVDGRIPFTQTFTFGCVIDEIGLYRARVDAGDQRLASLAFDARLP